MNTDPIVTDYLDRLEAAAAGLPPDQRIELVTDVRGHIDSALRAARASDEVTVRNVLERLGRPEDIVREAGQPADEQPDVASSTDGRDTAALIILSVGFLIAFLGVVLRGTTLLGPIEIGALAAWAIVAGYVTWRAVTRAPRRDRGGSLEIAAIVLLTAGGLVWIIWAWVAGYVLVWLSDVWKTRDKVVVAVVAVLLMPLGWGMTSPWFGTDLQLKGAFTFALGAGGLLAGAYLSWRLVQVSRHASTRRPQRRSWLVAAAAAVVLVGAVVAASALGGSGTEEGCAADACGPDTTVDQFERIGLDADRQDVAHTLGPPDRRESRWRWGPGVHPQAVQTQVPPAQSQYDDCWMYDLHGADDGLAHGTICFVADTVVYTGIEPAD